MLWQNMATCKYHQIPSICLAESVWPFRFRFSGTGWQDVPRNYGYFELHLHAGNANIYSCVGFEFSIAWGVIVCMFLITPLVKKHLLRNFSLFPSLSWLGPKNMQPAGLSMIKCGKVNICIYIYIRLQLKLLRDNQAFLGTHGGIWWSKFIYASGGSIFAEKNIEIDTKWDWLD